MLRKIWALSANIMLILAFSEGFLWLIALYSGSVNLLLSNVFGAPRMIEDPLLGNLPNPDFAEHDEWGYRNALIGPLGLRSRRVPSQVDVVVLGDSQTYGINSSAEDAWPARLSEYTCRSVYNMAVPASGPPHYLYNLDKALKLDPDLVIVGFYFGNDFWGSADFVYHRARVPQAFESWRKAYRDANPDYVALTDELFPMDVQRSLDSARILEPGFSKALPADNRQPEPAIKEGGIGGFIRDNSKLYGLLRALKSAVRNSYLQPGREENKTRVDPHFWKELCDFAAETKGVVCYESKNVQTVLDTRLRLTDERILHAGMEITMDIFLNFRDRLRTANTDFVVALIP